MKTRRIILCKIIPIVFAFAITTFAQQDSSATQWRAWLQPELGWSNIGGSGGYLVGFQSDEHFFGVRYLGGNEMIVNFSPTPSQWMDEIAILYGPLNFHIDNIIVSISGGIGKTYGIRRGAYIYTSKDFLGTIEHYEQIDYSTIGLALNIELSKPVLSFFGYGFNIVGNWNKEQSFIGVFVCIQIGKVKLD